jgi:hypothetical protein
MNVALRARWLWLQKTDTTKPWSGLDLQVGSESIALFNASVQVQIGSGASTLFWEDAWLDGLTAEVIAPDLVELVRPSIRRRRTVREGRQANAWASDISGELSVDALVQYLRLWEAVQRVHLPVDSAAPDSFRWKWNGDGQFSARSAYRMLFHGTTGLPAAHLVWASFAPLKYKMHAWLALRRRCWTADRRLRRGLPTHTLCPLCDAADETLDHLSLHCVFTRRVWAGLISRLQLPDLLPSPEEGINDWWCRAAALFAKAERRRANSLIMLTLRSIWLERNARVFEDKRTDVLRILSLILDEWQSWLVCRGRPPRDVH